MLAPLRSLRSLPVGKTAARSFTTSQSLFASGQQSLEETLPDLPTPKGSRAAPTAVQVSTLGNGVRVATSDLQGEVASVGVTVKAGSRSDDVFGTAHFLEHMAYKTTQTRSTLRMARDFELIGARVSAAASRETLSYSGESLRDDVDFLVARMGESITQPKLRYWEVDEEKLAFKERVAAIQANPVVATTEGLHAAAFGAGSALGHSIYADATKLKGIDDMTLRQYLNATFRAGNMVVSATNVDHKEFVAFCEEQFLSVPGDKAEGFEAAEYQGGESMIRAHTPSTYLAVGFKAPDLSSNDVLTMGVAQVLLGTLGGSKSGLIEKAVSKNGDFVESLSAFAFPYSDVGLFGLAGTTNDANAAQLVGLMANLMKEVASGNVSSDDVTRAKNLLKMALVDSSASRDGKRDDVATQLLMKGSYTETSDVFAAIDKVTGAQIGTLVSNMLKSSPSISGVGELSTVPGYDRIAAQFQ